MDENRCSPVLTSLEDLLTRSFITSFMAFLGIPDGCTYHGMCIQNKYQWELKVLGVVSTVIANVGYYRQAQFFLFHEQKDLINPVNDEQKSVDKEEKNTFCKVLKVTSVQVYFWEKVTPGAACSRTDRHFLHRYSEPHLRDLLNFCLFKRAAILKPELW